MTAISKYQAKQAQVASQHFTFAAAEYAELQSPENWDRFRLAIIDMADAANRLERTMRNQDALP